MKTIFFYRILLNCRGIKSLIFFFDDDWGKTVIFCSNSVNKHQLNPANHGYQIWPQSGSHWPKMGQIREIFRSDSVHFGAVRQNVLYLIWKNPRFVPFGANLIQFWWQIWDSCPGNDLHGLKDGVTSSWMLFLIYQNGQKKTYRS